MSHFLPFLIVHPSLPPNQSTVKDHNILLTCEWYEVFQLIIEKCVVTVSLPMNSQRRKEFFTMILLEYTPTGSECSWSTQRANFVYHFLQQMDEIPFGLYILIIFAPIVWVLFMVGETFWGLIGVGGVIVGVGLPILFEMRKGRFGVENMLNFLRNAAQSSVDEKIAVLYRYTRDVPSWKEKGINIQLMNSQIVADIRAIGRVYIHLSLEQWEEFHKATRLLIEAIRKEGFEVGDIEDVRNALR